jgi:hypothetical protein
MVPDVIGSTNEGEMQDGNVYVIDFFHAERRPYHSTFSIIAGVCIDICSCQDCSGHVIQTHGECYKPACDPNSQTGDINTICGRSPKPINTVHTNNWNSAYFFSLVQQHQLVNQEAILVDVTFLWVVLQTIAHACVKRMFLLLQLYHQLLKHQQHVYVYSFLVFNLLIL